MTSHRRNSSLEKSPFAIPYPRNRAPSTTTKKHPLIEMTQATNSPSPLKRSDALPNLLNIDGTPSRRRIREVRKQASVDNLPGHRDSPFGTPHAALNPSVHVKRPHPLRQSLKVVERFKLDMDDFSTPPALNGIKPLATAFMSTGLLSKRNRELKGIKPMPDTPCKRPMAAPESPVTPIGSTFDDYMFFDDSIYASSNTEFEPHTPTRNLFEKAIPTSLGRFKNVERLGSGEFSEVFLVESDQKYAVKRTKHAYSTARERARRREEVEILQAIGKHEHIVDLIDSWEEVDHLFIQFEYCENGSLDVFLRDLGRTQRLDEFRVWKILTELALGLSYIHDRGFLHLDLKPANIFITFEGVLKIGDFGMSVIFPAPAHIEREGDREYIAPEVLNSGRYDKPVDIFSLGLIILEVAANIVLPENGLSWQKLRSGDLSDAPKLSSSDNEDVPHRILDPVPPHRYIGQGGLDRVVKWMLTPDPSERPEIGQVMQIEEVNWVNRVRRAGAVIYEGDRGPEVQADYDIYMVNEEIIDDDGDDWRMEM